MKTQNNHKGNFQCKTCGKSFTFLRYLRQHENVHKESHVLKCQICRKHLRGKASFRAHLRTHNANRVRRFKCRICFAKFLEKDSLGRHMHCIHNVQTNANISYENCVFCGKGFCDVTSYHQHLRVHTMERPFFCKLCPAELSQKSHIKKHYSSTHQTNREATFKCDFCSKMFYSKSKMQDHIRIHTKERFYKCEVCRKELNSPRGLVEHMRIHSGEKPFSCEICQQTFSRKLVLTNHIRSHTKEKCFKCTYCGKGFTHKSVCTFHEKRIHLGEKRLNYSCSVCGKNFVSKTHLRIHSRVHTGEKPYSCKLCGKAFSHKCSLKVHANIHDDSLRQCRFCPRKFSRSCDCKKHENSAHTK